MTVTGCGFGTLVEMIWRRLGLSGAPPVVHLLASGPWQLIVDGFGAALFRRTIVQNQQVVVELSDLLQLIYLGGTDRRILVSTDKAFLATADGILSNRYPGARVLSWEEFAAMHQPL